MLLSGVIVGVFIADVNTNNARDSPAINAEPSHVSTDHDGLSSDMLTS